jgi:hypothetical protein
MARRKKVGDIYRFNFDEKFHCYCQILEANDVAFFKYYSDAEDDNINEVIEKDEVFRIWLDRDCLKSDKWKFICNKELSEERKTIFYKYNNPAGGTDFFIFKNVENTVFTKVGREQCFGLELAAAWMESGVIDRLNYSFFGKPLPEHIKNDIPFYE